jgi:outer membrane biosynthesis protein TonB
LFHFADPRPGKVRVREQRLLTSLLVSFTLHMAFLAFVPPLLSRPPSSLKRPLWVDLVDLKEPSDPAPSLLRPSPSTEASSQVSKRAPTRQTVLSRQIDKPGAPPQEAREPPVPRPRPLPSVRDLIPSVNNLLGRQRAYDNPLDVEPSRDGDQGIHRGPHYEAYIRDLKEAVKKNWKVSGDGESKRATTVLRISIGPDGSLASLDLLESCGMVLHDYEALEAIKQSFPLRSPPETLLDEHGKLSIRFSFHLLPDPTRLRND